VRPAPENWEHLQKLRPDIELVADPVEVLQSDVDVALIITPPETHPHWCERPWSMASTWW